MKIENLRTLIRESIAEYVKEIDEAASDAADAARIAKCEEAIATRESKLNTMEESEHRDLMDEGKIKALENEIKELKKAKAKFEKAAEKKAAKKAKKSAPKEEEVVTDAVTEEAPIDETDVMAGMDVAEETTINESFLKMQKLAGVITESQYNQKIKMLNEDLRAGVYNDFIKWKESFEDGTEFPQENGYVVAKKDGQEVGKWNPISKLGMHANDAQYKTL